MATEMTGIIRKAVELADGWHMRGDNWFYYERQNGAFPIENLPKQAIDALAAQLVRQVDALPVGETEVWVRRSISWIEHEDSDTPIKRCDGLDRTMNTLRAIIESKVLE